MRPLLGLLAAALLSSCGYHVSGKADTLPPTLKTIAIPAFGNATTRYKLTDHLPEALSREFLTRTRYKVVSDIGRADAVLKGTVVTYTAYPTVLDRDTGRATTIEVHVVIQVSLTERATGKILYTRPNYDYRERYEISIDPAQYFEESDAALDRVSRQVARDVVSSVLENF